MGLKVYLPAAIAAFLAGTTGSDLIARTSIGGETLGFAIRDHLYWAAIQAIGTILLLAPFVAVAMVCARFEKTARTRGIATIFVAATAVLLYYYFNGYLGSQRALLDHKWTTAALSIGLLPFFIGIPVVLVATVAAAIAARFDRRTPD